jgi:hypothetical protein
MNSQFDHWKKHDHWTNSKKDCPKNISYEKSFRLKSYKLNIDLTEI